MWHAWSFASRDGGRLAAYAHLTSEYVPEHFLHVEVGQRQDRLSSKLNQR